MCGFESRWGPGFSTIGSILQTCNSQSSTVLLSDPYTPRLDDELRKRLNCSQRQKQTGITKGCQTKVSCYWFMAEATVRVQPMRKGEKWIVTVKQKGNECGKSDQLWANDDYVNRWFTSPAGANQLANRIGRKMKENWKHKFYIRLPAHNSSNPRAPRLDTGYHTTAFNPSSF